MTTETDYSLQEILSRLDELESKIELIDKSNELPDLDLADLENRVLALETKSTEDENTESDDMVVATSETCGSKSEDLDFPPNHPFEVVYDGGSWKTYLPSGCVKIGDEAATFEASDAVGSLSSGYATISSPSTMMYCHVYEDDDDTYTYTIDASATDTDAILSFAVFGFDTSGDNANEIAVQYSQSVVMGYHIGKTLEIKDLSVDAEAGITLDSTDGIPKVTISDGTNKIELDTADLDGADLGIHTLTVGDDVYYVLSDTDIDLTSEDEEEEGGSSSGSSGTAGVISVNSAAGALSVIGGGGISVTTNGQTITITYQEGKEADSDPNSSSSSDDCDHNGDGGVSGGDGSGGGDAIGGGGVGGADATVGGGGGGCNDCGPATVGGSASGGTSSSSSEGKQTSTKPSGASSGSASSGAATTSTAVSVGKTGSGTSSNGKAATGSSATAASTSLYGGTHKALTNSKTMNESPYKTSGNYTAIGSRSTTQIYSGTHKALTNSKTMNESPFKSK